MKVYVPTRVIEVPVPGEPRKVNITRGSSKTALKELFRLTGSSNFSESGTYVVSGKDLVVFARLAEFAYNIPADLYNGWPATDITVDGDGANTTGA